MLDVKDINAAYGQVKVLNGVSLNVDAGEILCVMGRNGAGKTTLLKTVMGIVRATSGSITLDDQELTKLENHQIPKMGIGYIPQGRRLFPELTVEENIE
ncbi:ATP-binding cassette domain-containing protein, partial [Paracoccaceae bacterium]|nr:ATP-binding cassette domain-containing protein [Paracoccaceae bacterium]